MKVIGKGSGSIYICEVDHTELEKFLGLYYNHLKALQVGDVVDLGKGYDHARDISAAMEKTREFIKAHQKVINCIIDGLRVEYHLKEQGNERSSE